MPQRNVRSAGTPDARLAVGPDEGGGFGSDLLLRRQAAWMRWQSAETTRRLLRSPLICWMPKTTDASRL